MFDIGWTELLVVGVVALIVVGPKDLPGMFRTLGRFTGKMKGMAREFQRAMDDAADQSGVKDVAKDLKNATSSKNLGLDALNKAADKFDKWQPGMAPKTGDAAKGSETAKLAAERSAASDRLRATAADKAAAKADTTPAPKAPEPRDPEPRAPEPRDPEPRTPEPKAEAPAFKDDA